MKRVLVLFWVVWMGIGVAWAEPMEEMLKKIRRDFPGVPQLSTGKLAAWLADEKREPPLLIDARTEEEYVVGHLPGARRAEPGASLEALLTKVPTNTPIVVYCSVGVRSSRMAEGLIAGGYLRVFNLEGSLFKWANEGRVLAEGKEVVHPYNRRWGQLLKSGRRAEPE